MTKQGYHLIRMGFSGKDLSEPCTIVFKNKPPVLRVESLASDTDHAERIIRGKAASELQIPGETISVELVYFHEGAPQKIDVPVITKTDEETDICYFEFETTIQGLPVIPADDPRYASPFFGFKIKDQADNSYYHEQSYAQYMAPGTNRFGFNNLAKIKVEKLTDAGELKNIIRVIPAQFTPQPQLPNGEPAIRIEVTGTLKTSRFVKIKSNVKNKLPMTLVLRDDKQIGRTLTDEYVDKEKLDKKTAEYRVEQKGADGMRYISNTVPVSDSEKIMLTIRSNVYEDTVYIDDKEYGSTPLFDVKLEKGRHTVRVEKNGCEPYEKKIDLQHEFPPVKAKLYKILRIETEPTGATVTVNKGEKYVSPVELKIQARKSTDIYAELKGYELKHEVVKISCERSEPLRLILEAVSKTYRLRSKPRTLSEDDVKTLIKKHNFYCKEHGWTEKWYNESGNFKNDFKDNKNDTITDNVTGLMWQQSGSDTPMTHVEAQAYIDDLNRNEFKGYDDWRLPTLEELASLLESKKVNNRYINPLFDKKQLWCWTADKMASGGAWYVDFNLGNVYWHNLDNGNYVRGVRSRTM